MIGTMVTEAFMPPLLLAVMLCAVGLVVATIVMVVDGLADMVLGKSTS